MCITIFIIMTKKPYYRKLMSVSFRPEEWEFLLENLPDFTNFSKYARQLILKSLNYQPNKSKNTKDS